jgi:hypothetical protein
MVEEPKKQCSSKKSKKPARQEEEGGPSETAGTEETPMAELTEQEVVKKAKYRQRGLKGAETKRCKAEAKAAEEAARALTAFQQGEEAAS